MPDTRNDCLARLGSDPCYLPAFHEGWHETFWGSRNEVRVMWSDVDEGAHPDPRVVAQ